MIGLAGVLSLDNPVALDIPVVLGRDEAQRRAAAELAKAKYGGLPDWVSNLLASVRGLIDRLLKLIPTGTGSGSGIVVVIVAVLLVAAIAVIIWRVGLPRMERRRSESELTVDVTRTPDSYRRQADGAAENGDFRAAIGDRFRAIVRELEERTILDPRPARTATEVARSAARILTGQHDSLDRAAALFSDVTYSDQTADQNAYHQMCALDAELVAAADQADLGPFDQDGLGQNHLGQNHVDQNRGLPVGGRR